MAILDDVLLRGFITPSIGLQPGGVLGQIDPNATAPGAGIDPGVAPTVPRAIAQQAQPQSRGILDQIASVPGLADGLMAAGQGLLSSPNTREAIANAFGGFNKAFTDARKLTLEELKAKKPTLTPTGQPGIFQAVYPDGRMETVVVDEAVKQWQANEDRKDQRQQRQLDAQDERTNKTLANALTIATMKNGPGRALSGSVQKAEDADFEAIDNLKNTRTQIAPVIQSLQPGPDGKPKLDLGALSNAYNTSRNFFGKSTPESQAYADLQRTLTQITNESLRLNKGTQTEGDAQRATQELTAAFAKNDNVLMAKALKDLDNLNAQRMKDRQNQINRRRSSQKADLYDFGNNDAPTSTSGSTSTGVKYSIER